MISRIQIVFFLMFSFLFYGCKKERMGDCLKGTGEDITEVRNPGVFSGLRVADRFDIELIDSSEYYVEITAGSNLMNGIATEVQEGILTIRNENKCNMVRDYQRKMNLKVYGKLKDIWMDSDGLMWNSNAFSNDTLFFHLTGNDANLTLNNKFFFCDMYETGNLTLTGKCNRVSISLTSYGSYFGKNLESQYAVMYNSGEGDMHVGVTDSLTAAITRVGNIYYPASTTFVQLDHAGEGEFIEE